MLPFSDELNTFYFVQRAVQNLIFWIDLQTFYILEAHVTQPQMDFTALLDWKQQWITSFLSAEVHNQQVSQ